ncbi:MAG: L,D-transpeptidase [Candidatus Eisenbacteria bacterium]|uniref:L,D-transpeptidase n=1 Tax=Eiseniibacteriota bacterium TaxID=2212470 RepID=A0A948S0Q1_UNCEI|nr:L,D-transpeptidase [Candidatus Eisenbacteria bacterium]MBU1949803.1 L,D-transpeptidase [Candidatus Eisenbacteria bacterium]MBU2691699.1 L,D-transpeptidase [Candidatus Eisenbacteria bacterium]
MSHRTGKIILRISGLLFCAALAAVILYIKRPMPPLKALWAVQDACQRARESGAEQYAAGLLEASEDSLQVAGERMKRQGRRLYFLRDFTPALRTIEGAALKAAEAESVTRAAQDSLTLLAMERIMSAAGALSQARELLAQHPARPDTRRLLGRLDILLEESDWLLDREMYEESILKSQIVSDSVSWIEEQIQGRLDRYLKSSDDWEFWARETLDWSRQTGQPVLIVRKLDHACDLYVRGKRIQKYKVDLGRQWMGDKMHQGDQMTPEGIYRIVLKLGPEKTRFHKALRLDYPNEGDRERFQQAVLDGRISPRTNIGGLIEIHGHGGRGVDWTEGCIALEDSDMDDLFDRVPVGTQVAIVGTHASDVKN